jgi:protein TonB
VLLPDPEKVMPHWNRIPSTLSVGEGKPEKVGEVHSQRVRQGGAVTAASLIQRVQPEYPEVARQERTQGTVHLHALIGTDGTIRGLRVASGACSLSRSAYDAVRRWRYRPTTINGAPVEVDTTIDVIFSLRQ